MEFGCTWHKSKPSDKLHTLISPVGLYKVWLVIYVTCKFLYEIQTGCIYQVLGNVTLKNFALRFEYCHSRQENCFLSLLKQLFPYSCIYLSVKKFIKGSVSCWDRRQLHLDFQKVFILSKMIESLSNPGGKFWNYFLKKLVVHNLEGTKRMSLNPNETEEKPVCVFTTIPQILYSANVRVQVLYKKSSGVPGMGSVLTSHGAENEPCFLKSDLMSEMWASF